jgi:hypothetical protein
MPGEDGYSAISFEAVFTTVIAAKKKLSAAEIQAKLAELNNLPPKERINVLKNNNCFPFDEEYIKEIQNKIYENRISNTQKGLQMLVTDWMKDLEFQLKDLMHDSDVDKETIDTINIRLRSIELRADALASMEIGVEVLTKGASVATANPKISSAYQKLGDEKMEKGKSLYEKAEEILTKEVDISLTPKSKKFFEHTETTKLFKRIEAVTDLSYLLSNPGMILDTKLAHKIAQTVEICKENKPEKKSWSEKKFIDKLTDILSFGIKPLIQTIFFKDNSVKTDFVKKIEELMPEESLVPPPSVGKLN